MAGGRLRSAARHIPVITHTTPKNIKLPSGRNMTVTKLTLAITIAQHQILCFPINLLRFSQTGIARTVQPKYRTTYIALCVSVVPKILSKYRKNKTAGIPLAIPFNSQADNKRTNNLFFTRDFTELNTEVLVVLVTLALEISESGTRNKRKGRVIAPAKIVIQASNPMLFGSDQPMKVAPAIKAPAARIPRILIHSRYDVIRVLSW